MAVVKEFPASVIHHFDSSKLPLGDVTHRGALVWSTPSISPALIGVGYVIGFELGAINFAGGVLAWFVLVPFALFLDPDLGARLHGASGARRSPELVYTIWYNQIRPIAVGAMLVGAAWTLWRMRDSLLQAFRGAFHAGSRRSRCARRRTSRRAGCCSGSGC